MTPNDASARQRAGRCRTPWFWTLLLIVAASLPGCSGGGKGTSLSSASSGSKPSGGFGIPFTPFRVPGTGGGGGDSSGVPNPEAVRSQVMSLSDTYCQTVIQSLDGLIAATKDPKRAQWARAQRVATMMVSMTNATEPNAVVGLLDMVVFATLKRAAVEEHWVPTLLGEEGGPVVEAHRRGEAEAWAAAGRTLSRQQIQELRVLVQKWQREHAGQYYVGFTRFSDFEAFRNLTPESPEAKAPGSLFGALYLDPLAGLDPMAKELRGYRALTERLAFMGSRMPMLLAYQVDLAVKDATSTPEILRVVASTEKFAASTEKFAEAVVKYPRDFSAEREAAVKQVAAAAEHERQAIIKQLEQQDGRVRAIVGDVTRLVERAEQAGTSLNQSTAQTVTTTEQATRRIMNQAFWLSLVLLVVVLFGVPAAVLAYRVARNRIENSPPRPPHVGALT